MKIICHLILQKKTKDIVESKDHGLAKRPKKASKFHVSVNNPVALNVVFEYTLYAIEQHSGYLK